ncbi:hypothetical protein C1646_822395 [Rhizophagus diaphanus]|nr:hypothetical protein C1646_822395 [Rhizophagus diaphanus] [Rhizophagus sp. MUCL 43196]
MTESDKILTAKYLDWHSKLIGLPSILTDKIHSKLYKRYKKQTGNEPWQLTEAHASEGHLLRNLMPENKVSSIPEQCEEEGPITFEARPDPEPIIHRGARHALFVMENMGIMDYMVNGIKMEQNIVLLASLQAINSNSRSTYYSPNPAYLELYEENERLKRERVEMLDGYNKFKALQKERQQPPWEPSPKKQRIMTQGTATLFAGEIIPSSWGHFDEIVNRGYTFIDKTSLIAEFIECASGVSLVVRPRRFGKTTNLTMLKEFFSIPIYPDNEKYRRELFRDTKITERSCLLRDHFCKYPVIFLSLKGFDGCDTWLKMEAFLCAKLALLYEEHSYIEDILNDYKKLRFNKIRSGDLEYAVTIQSLEDLSRYLKTYHRRRCIVLIDEYDHPLEIAYRYQYYEEARGFFSSLFGALLKDNDKNLEKALFVGVSRIAKSGYLSGLNNLNVFPMYVDKYATQFGFTEDEISIFLQHCGKKKRLNEVKEWYDGYRAGNGICLYNPWSINQFIDTNTLEAHWVDTGAIDVEILKDIDYNTLSPHASDVIWTLLYYGGYLTMNEDKNLCIPNMEVFAEWKGWLNSRISSKPDTMLEMLLQCNLTKFEEELPTMIMESLSYFDTTDSDSAERNYHFLMIGILSPVRYRNYELLSNREAGEGRFDVRIVPITENVIYPISIIMEFKVYKKNKKNIDNDEYGDEDEDKTERWLRKKSEEALAQIVEKKYRTGIKTTTLVECGIAFQGKHACVSSRVLHKEGNRWLGAPAIIISHMGLGGVYANPVPYHHSFIDLQGDYG